MDYLYLLLNLGSISIPFLFSFHPKLKFYKYWKSLFLAIAITMFVFIVWDIVFAHIGVWGFNETYLIKLTLLGLPIEEWLFFICIPYACIFTHYALLLYFPKLNIKISSVTKISYVLITVLLALSILNHGKWYTFINFLYAAVILILVLKTKPKLLQSYYLTFLIMLIPFFIVNGILTGSMIENEVVWYNNAENLNIRLFTIPIEDTVYAFSLILTNLFLMKLFTK